MNSRNKTLMFAAVVVLVAPVNFARADEPARPVAAERFVPRAGTSTCAGGRMEVRSETTVSGTDITLKQLCKWSDADDAALSTVGDLVIDRFDDGDVSRVVQADKIKTVLRQAGTNLSVIRLSGSMQCLVTRGAAVPQPVKLSPAETAALVAGVTGNLKSSEAQPVEAAPVKTLRDRLTEDLSQRLNIPMDRLQMSFAAKDTNTLNMAEPAFHFEIEPRIARDLGHVSWDVAVVTGTGVKQNREKLTISAQARAWEDDLVMTRPVNSGQVLTDNDVTDRRVLVDTIPNDPVLTRNQIVGQQAARSLKTGSVLTAKVIDPVTLARSGDRVTVNLTQGTVRMTTAATALESGSLGQSIRVRNDQTREVYEITLTGSKTGEVGGSTAVAVSN